MKTYLINLDRSSDRLGVMIDRLKTIGIAFERVAGIDGIKLKPEDYSVNAPNPLYPHPLTPGEIGCYLSHKKCWQQIVDSKEDWGLVLEDDCIFQSSASRYLTNLNWIPAGCKLIHFYYTAKRPAYTDKTISLEDGNTLFCARVSLPVGAYAYMMSREAALLALKLSETISEPVDNFLFGVFSPYPKLMPSWRLKGSVLVPCREIGTTIQGRKNKKNSLYSIHPKRLFRKFKICVMRMKLSPISHYLLKV